MKNFIKPICYAALIIVAIFVITATDLWSWVKEHDIWIVLFFLWYEINSLSSKIDGHQRNISLLLNQIDQLERQHQDNTYCIEQLQTRIADLEPQNSNIGQNFYEFINSIQK
jgi:peptidoglycan hydrolase CwlO-like protein